MNKGKLVFVVHKHDATTFHFDFRLQIGHVMPSWAIPRGPTLDPTVKRLARKTSAHSDSSVIWDKGTYIPEVEISKGIRKEIKDLEEGQKVMKEGLKKGEIKFFLNGKKLKGSFALVKTKGFPPGVKNAWLLIKHKDKFVKEGFDAKEE